MTFPFFWMIMTAFKSQQEILLVDQWLPRQKVFAVLPDGQKIQVEIIEQLSETQLKVRFPGVDDIREISTSTIEKKTWLFSNFKTAWYKVKPSFTRYFFVTIFVATVTTAGQLLTSILAAFAFVFFNFPGKNLLFTLFLATMMVPQQVLLVPNYLILSTLGWIDTFAALIVPWLAHVFGIFMLRQFFMQVPRDLLDAAIIDGCSKFGFLFRILIPLSIPPIVTIAIFTFLGSWNGLLWPLIVTNSQEMRTIQVGLSYFSQAEGTEWELLMAASTFCIMPLVLAYFCAQKYFVQGEATSGLKG